MARKEEFWVLFVCREGNVEGGCNFFDLEGQRGRICTRERGGIEEVGGLLPFLLGEPAQHTVLPAKEGFLIEEGRQEKNLDLSLERGSWEKRFLRAAQRTPGGHEKIEKTATREPIAT